MGSPELSTGKERLNGYVKALEDYRLKSKKEYIFQGSFAKNTGYDGAKRLLTIKDRPEAIFAGSDYLSLGVFAAADEMGIRIPEDIALVGFDDTEFSANPRIGLTTVSQQKYEMGKLGVQILIDFIEGEAKDYVNRIVLKPRLIIRESCGCKLSKNKKRIQQVAEMSAIKN